MSEKPKKLCRCGCDRAPVWPRRNWFSQECVDRYLLAKDQGYFRKKVGERDNGICAECQLNTEELEGKYRTASLRARSFLYARLYNRPYEPKNQEERIAIEWLAITDQRYPWARRAYQNHVSFWQADHIHPKHLGGPGTLENAQTLCLGCHYAKTARQRGLVMVPDQRPASITVTVPEVKHGKPAIAVDLRQPAGSLQCGQTCVAMITKRDREEVCRAINRFTETKPKHLAAALERYGFKLEPYRSGPPREWIDTAICAQKFNSGALHWVVWHRGRYYCPTRGTIDLTNAKITRHFEVKKA
jgi:5-methylcytosine-specific restriction endonuclease McrA